MPIKLLQIALIPDKEIKKGDVIAVVEAPNAHALAYFERIRLTANRPTSRILVPKPGEGWGLDSLGKLVKDGKFTYNQFGELVQIEDTKPKKSS